MNNIISIFDTSIAAYNSGNQVIMESVDRAIETLFPEDFLIKLPVEDIKANTRRYNSMSKISFIGGTNILNSDIRKYRQMDFSLHNILLLKNIVLLGCGWFQYEERVVSKYTQWAFNRILSHRYIHSVRDYYTQQKLESIGIKSINTGCPTLWNLTNEFVKDIPKVKPNRVVLTLTDYNRNKERDQLIIESCLSTYNEIYYFPQGTGDINYLKELGYFNKVVLLSPQLLYFNKILQQKDIDYVGTRLHTGIRALQMGMRSFIVGIDNRAVEMGRDFSLPVVQIDEIRNLPAILNQPYILKLNITFENIDIWKSQFRSI